MISPEEELVISSSVSGESFMGENPEPALGKDVSEIGFDGKELEEREVKSAMRVEVEKDEYSEVLMLEGKEVVEWRTVML